MRKKQQLITLRQLEDWLIYHCPLQKSTRDIHYEAKAHGMKDCTASRMPFMVKLDCIGLFLEFTAVHGTPWQTYRELAKLIWKDTRGCRYVTDLYHKS